MALVRAKNVVVDHVTYLANPEVPNHVVSSSAGGAVLFLAAVEALNGCGSFSTYLSLAVGLGLEAMALNQFGFGRAYNSGLTLFTSAKNAIMPAQAPEEPAPTSTVMKKAQ